MAREMKMANCPRYCDSRPNGQTEEEKKVSVFGTQRGLARSFLDIYLLTDPETDSLDHIC